MYWRLCYRLDCVLKQLTEEGGRREGGGRREEGGGRREGGGIMEGRGRREEGQGSQSSECNHCRGSPSPLVDKTIGVKVPCSTSITCLSYSLLFLMSPVTCLCGGLAVRWSVRVEYLHIKESTSLAPVQRFCAPLCQALLLPQHWWILRESSHQSGAGEWAQSRH